MSQKSNIAHPEKPLDWKVISPKPTLVWEMICAHPEKPGDWKAIIPKPTLVWEIIMEKPWDWWSISRNSNITWDLCAFGEALGQNWTRMEEGEGGRTCQM